MGHFYLCASCGLVHASLASSLFSHAAFSIDIQIFLVPPRWVFSTYFPASRCLTLDGILEGKNEGSEVHCFPCVSVVSLPLACLSELQSTRSFSSSSRHPPLQGNTKWKRQGQ